MKTARSLIRPNEGTVLLYAIDGDSQPASKSTTRTRMQADGPLVGLGVVFPHAEAEDPGEYWAVELDDQDADLATTRSEEHTSELQSRGHLVCRLLLEK